MNFATAAYRIHVMKWQYHNVKFTPFHSSCITRNRLVYFFTKACRVNPGSGAYTHALALKLQTLRLSWPLILCWLLVAKICEMPSELVRRRAYAGLSMRRDLRFIGNPATGKRHRGNSASANDQGIGNTALRSKSTAYDHGWQLRAQMFTKLPRSRTRKDWRQTRTGLG
jgi:hypothetical protein